MKKGMNWIGLLFCLLLPMGFIGCGSDDDDNTTTEVTLKEKVIGTWQASDVYTPNGWVSAAAAGWKSTTATFGTDGSYKTTGELGSGEGTYSVVGNEIVCLVKEKVMFDNYEVLEVRYLFEDLNGNTATVTISMPDGGKYKIRAIRK